MKIKEAILEKMISQLLELCKSELDLNELPSIELIDEPTVGGGTSFGEFSNNEIKVVISERHPMDVMRTLAHELVHWKQQLEGLKLDGSDGSNIENQANAVAGVIMRKFAKQHPECFGL
jgi:hypothetical protein